MKSEAVVQQDIRLEASRLGVRLWRNNSGAATDATGRLIRYGLGNDSAQINKRFKSADLIGLTPVLITPDMVGQVVGVFTAVEVKHDAWRGTTLNERELAQKAWLELVHQSGGFAGFANSVDTFKQIVRK